MRLNDDSELYQVSDVWLGPKGQELPWRARYSAYGVGFVVLIVVLIVERRVGVHAGVASTLVSLLATVLITKYVMRFVTHERPVATILATFWHELTSPRRVTKAQHVTFNTRRIQVYPVKRQDMP